MSRRRAIWRRRYPKPELRVGQILAWADAHRARTGRWPTAKSGEIREAPWDRWSTVDDALRSGARGLRAGSSVARLLAQYRGKRNPSALPPLTIRQILAWADAHHRRTGRWPSSDAHRRRDDPLGPGGTPVLDAPGETWNVIHQSLVRGLRGLPSGDSLPKLLLRCRRVRRIIYVPRLSIPQILGWADHHHRRTGRWPMSHSGRIREAPRETWVAVHEALLNGRRGLPGGSSLAMLLAEHRGVRNKGQLPHLKKRQILAWADAHFRRTGNYPNHKSGPIPEAPGESWSIVAHAFYRGHRGLPANYSLHKFLAEHGRRHIPPPRAPRIPKPLRPPLQLTQILRWADAHHARTGGFPKQGDGPIVEAPDTTWKAVDLALRKGSRGLPKRGSLRKFLIRSGREPILHRGFPPGTCLRPQLKLSQVLAWAKTHYRRTGTWPRRCSGRIPGARGETWNGVDHALARGARGLPASGSLYTFLLAHRAKPARTRRTS